MLHPASEQPTKTNIKKQFLSMYKSKPLRSIGVIEMVAACNIARSTFYFYFEDINALYMDCVRDAINYLESDISNVILCSVGQDIDQYVKALGTILLRLKEQSNVFQTLLIGSEGAAFRGLWIEAIYQNYLKTLSFSREFTKTQQNYLTHFFAAGTLSLFENWLLSGCKESPEEIAMVSAQVMFYGLHRE